MPHEFTPNYNDPSFKTFARRTSGEKDPPTEKMANELKTYQMRLLAPDSAPSMDDMRAANKLQRTLIAAGWDLQRAKDELARAVKRGKGDINELQGKVYDAEEALEATRIETKYASDDLERKTGFSLPELADMHALQKEAASVSKIFNKASRLQADPKHRARELKRKAELDAIEDLGRALPQGNGNAERIRGRV